MLALLLHLSFDTDNAGYYGEAEMYAHLGLDAELEDTGFQYSSLTFSRSPHALDLSHTDPIFCSYHRNTETCESRADPVRYNRECGWIVLHVAQCE